MSALTIPPNFTGSSGIDTIQVITTAFNDLGLQVNHEGIINTLGGNDAIRGTATGDSSYGINNDGLIMLGTGDDSIKGVGSFAGMQVSGPLRPGVLHGGKGQDTITGIANSTGFTHNAIGIAISGYLKGGRGHDMITGEARGDVSGNVSTGLTCSGGDPFFSSTAGTLNGGNGNDVITGLGINENGFGYGITTFNKGIVRGGNGNDIITGYGTTAGYGTVFSRKTGEGSTLIDGGAGKDYFKARRINADGTESANQGGAVENALIFGGNGNDTFDVGYGNATVNGGQGVDDLILLGSADDFTIKGRRGNLTIERDGYVLTALNIENIVFKPDYL